MLHHHHGLHVTILLFYFFQKVASFSYPRINELSDKGTRNTCNGEDWIELYFDGNATNNSDDTSSAFDLSGYILHDDNGPNDSEAFTFKNGTIINTGQYLLLCLSGEDASISPQFGIGGDDQVTLVGKDGSMVSTSGQLSDRGEVDVSFSYDESSMEFVYTSTPSPGDKNIITLLPEPETVDEMRERLIAQNEMGTKFFDMDGNGLPVEGGFDEIVDLRMEVDPLVWDQMYEDQSYEIYSNFISTTVTKMDDESTVLLNLNHPGRFRPKGQSTLVVGTCLDSAVPYSIDFDYYNETQTLFGVQRAYLRTHIGDPSFVREWAQHRMLARFGLPHMRTRKVRFFVNDAYVGLYDLIEAPDQNYVFQRSFPNFDPEYYGLYKMKSFTSGCGAYADASISQAEARINETGTPPYAFERGKHRPKIPVLGSDSDTSMFGSCFSIFFGNIMLEFDDVALAYVRAIAADNTTSCGEFLVNEGLFDRDLGANSLDDSMARFYDKHLGINGCKDPQCSNSDLQEDVDITNFLKNFAVMASVLYQDSPMGNGNNYYLAQASGADNKLKIVQYDHNNILSDASGVACDLISCSKILINWSIERPTCRALESNQIVGPLLTNPDMHSTYIDLVREFAESVMTNQTFLDQVHNHLNAIKTEVPKDSYNDLADSFSLELDQSSDQWLHYVENQTYIPFLPAIKARSADIMKQLDAISKGSIPPRDLNDIKWWETCVNWKSEAPPQSSCYENCYYDGCYRRDFSIPSFCDEERGVCSHGVTDALCEGVPIFGSYPGMEESFEGSDKQTFCFQNDFLGPVRVADCPEPDLASAKTSAAATMLVWETFFFLSPAISAFFLFVS